MVIKKYIPASILIFICGLALAGHAQTTAFTYQGSLANSGVAANGNYDFQFLLFDASTGGSQLGATVSANSVAVGNGIFSVSLDFGNQFPGAARFLEIRVQQSGGGSYTTLSPRQPINSAPYNVKSFTADTAANAQNAVNSQNAVTATNAQQLGGVAASGYLQTNGNGSALTNLNASSITTGTLANTRLGQIPTANIADAAVTSPKIAPGQAVKSVNSLTDNVTLAAGSNVTITPSGNTLTIASTGGSGGVGGSGTVNSIPVFSGGTTIGNSQITQSAAGVQLPNGVQLAAGAQGNAVTFGSPNGETGMTISGGIGRADLRFDGTTLKLVAGGAGAIPSANSGIAIDSTRGFVGIGITQPNTKLEVRDSQGTAIQAIGGFSGVQAVGDTGILGTGRTGDGVIGQGVTGVSGYINSGTSGVGVRALAGQTTPSTNSVAFLGFGTSWFTGDTTPLNPVNAPGSGVGIGSTGTTGYLYAYDYVINTARNLAINSPGGRVGIGTNAPDQTLSVNGNASKPGGGSWLAFSDERLKNIKGRFTPGLSAVMRLQPLRYQYKKDNAMGLRAEGEFVGFGAQAVEKVIPEAVSKNEQGYRLVNNDPIMWTMLNAIKEQQHIIESQQKQINQLKRAVCSRRKKTGVCTR